MKKVLIFILAATTVTSVNAQTTPKTTAKTNAAKPVMKNLLDSFSYAAGINVATNMKEQGISDLNTALMYKAIDDIFKNKEAALSKELVNSSLQKQLEVFAKSKAINEKAKGIAFLEANKKNPGVIVLPSGLQYQVVKYGDSLANKPKAADTIVVNYIGTFIDGKEFDNSFKRGQPAVYPLSIMIQGWKEALQMMTVGSHWKLFVPAELAYAERGGGGGVIPPNATLVFEIELEGIKPAVEAPKTGN